MSQKPSVGRVVHYTLTEADAEFINSGRSRDGDASRSALAPHGNQASEGDVLPLIVVRVWQEDQSVNGQVLCDGNDSLWITSVTEGEGPGSWSWPPRV